MARNEFLVHSKSIPCRGILTWCHDEDGDERPESVFVKRRLLNLTFCCMGCKARKWLSDCEGFSELVIQFDIKRACVTRMSDTTTLIPKELGGYQRRITPKSSCDFGTGPVSPMSGVKTAFQSPWVEDEYCDLVN